MSILLGVFIALVTSLAANIYVEWLRVPRLVLSAEDPRDDTYGAGFPANQTRSLTLKLTNRDLPPLARWLLRTPAMQCQAAITFHDLNGKDRFGDAMAGRWAKTPEPVPLKIVDNHGNPAGTIADPDRPTFGFRIDIYPGESESLGLVIRADNETDCYGFNNESYGHGWRNPKWKLPNGTYLVKVLIRSSGRRCVGCFRLVNGTSRAELHLENASAAERSILGS
ncbi:MAG TPA: hypothetical protein VN823_27185 [Stellaceae bacterium]|nr:hypothetical protein [Stellaceae bacterium]